MSTERERIEAILEEERARAEVTRTEFVDKNPDILGLIDAYGLTLEYVKDSDYFYATIGEPREGVAFVLGNVIAFADPDTLECLGTEVMDFAKSVRSGKLEGGWAELLKILEERPIRHIPPKYQRPTSSEAERPNDIAQLLQGELAMAGSS